MRLLFIGLLLVLSLGCQMEPRQRIVGNWMADRTKTKLPQTPFPQYEKQARKLMNSATVKFSMDGSAIFTGTVPVEGKWTYEEGKVRLVPNDPELLERIPFVEKEIVFEVDPEFKHLVWRLDSPFGPIILVLQKTG